MLNVHLCIVCLSFTEQDSEIEYKIQVLPNTKRKQYKDIPANTYNMCTLSENSMLYPAIPGFEHLVGLCIIFSLLRTVRRFLI